MFTPLSVCEVPRDLRCAIAGHVESPFDDANFLIFEGIREDCVVSPVVEVESPFAKYVASLQVDEDRFVSDVSEE